MDAEARNQYLRQLREEYGLARKVVIRKLAHPVTLVRRPRATGREPMTLVRQVGPLSWPPP